MANEFSIDIQKFIKKAGDNVDRFMLEFTQDLYQEVVERSPVKTGFFKASWQPSINAPVIGPDRGDQDATYAQTNFTANLIGVKGGDIVYISNNAVYGPRLEYGWSPQAPQGMVRVTRAKAPSIAKKALARIKV